MRPALITLLCVCAAGPARAASFYVDPQIGSTSGDGSAAKPWRTIQEVIAANLVETQGWDKLPYSASTSTLVKKNAGAPIKAGDTIWLRSGYHGELTITGHYNASAITIAAQTGHTPKLARVVLTSSSNWKLQGLHFSPSYASTYVANTMVKLQTSTYSGPLSDIVVDGCSLLSIADTSSWTATDWDQKAANGIEAAGTRVTLRNNTLKNVDFGISVTATLSLVERNTVENFSGDGLRGLGDHTVFQYNTVKNCYAVNTNHDDGFQSWSTGTDGQVGTGQVTGIVLRGNVIINYTDANQPYRGTLQGIGCFDGTFVDWIVENNVIITDHWHGITLLGAKNCRIVNNTVIDSNTVKPGPPWIKIDAHKDGTAPQGCVVRNNLTTALSNATSGVTADHNLIVTSLTTHFVSPSTFDLHLLAGSPAINAGSSTLAPSVDIEGTPRPQGTAVDIGAYEWHTPGLKFDGAGDGPSGDGARRDGVAGADRGRGERGWAGEGGAGPDGHAGDGAERGSDGCSCTLERPGPRAPAWPLVALVPLLVAAGRRRARVGVRVRGQGRPARGANGPRSRGAPSDDFEGRPPSSIQ